IARSGSSIPCGKRIVDHGTRTMRPAESTPSGPAHQCTTYKWSHHLGTRILTSPITTRISGRTWGWGGRSRTGRREWTTARISISTISTRSGLRKSVLHRLRRRRRIRLLR
ncbi:hypothetical protein LTR60_007160, partial [Cryomyces antarcticus]